MRALGTFRTKRQPVDAQALAIPGDGVFVEIYSACNTHVGAVIVAPGADAVPERRAAQPRVSGSATSADDRVREAPRSAQREFPTVHPRMTLRSLIEHIFRPRGRA